MTFGADVVTARFVRLAEGAHPDIGVPPAVSGTCSSYLQPPHEIDDLFMGPVALLDAGDLGLTGPGLDLNLPPLQMGGGVVYAASLPSPVEQGVYSVNGVGGADVGPFGPVDLAVPSRLTMTSSLEAGTEVSRGGSLTLTWAGGDAMDIVFIHGRAFAIPTGQQTPVEDPMRFHSQAFVCSTTAGSGSFAIPEHVLKSLPEGLLVLNITHMPSESGIARFEATGLDLGGVFRWIDTTAYLDLQLVP
jgi:hypothetical protein